MTRVKYPAAPRVDLIEIRHGIPVADPFRPLENGDDPATAAWVDAENRLTRELLDTPHRHRLVERLRVLHRFTRMSVPAVRGARIFFTENDGKKNQAVLYGVEARDSGLGTRGSGLGARDSGLGGRGSGLERRMLVDPNALDADGTTALTAFEPDDRGGRVVYALSRDGSDMQELRVHDVASGAVLSDVVRWVKFASIAWTDDGFFYTRFPAPQTVPPEHAQYFCQVWFHRLGEAQETDRLVYERPDAPEVVFDVDVTSDGRLLVITSRRGASDDAEVHVVRLKPDPTGPDPTGDTFTLSPVASGVRRTIVSGFSSGWHFIDGVDDHLYFWTDAGAPLGRVVRFDLRDTHAEPRDVIAESADKISLAVVSRGRLFVSYLVNASDRLRMFELDGRPAGEIELPGPGTIVGLAGRWSDDACYLTFTSFTAPPQILVCDVDARRAAPIEPCATTIDPSQYLTEQAWYRSKDGTRVSMFLVRRVDVTLPAPVVLSGYGGFNISLTPTFDPSDFLWLDAGGMIAVANLRGGGEYGEAWHRAGMLDRKQNVFDDFIAAAEWLLATGRAAPGGIAIEGGSNGGLLVGAVMTQRPELFGAVVCRVPVADMLRYHLFTVGRFWIPEYGCADDPKQCTYLLRYSPYHNVRDGVSYPPTLVMTADTDDRVAPGMAKKFVARLQEAVLNTTGGPILLRVETRAGHGIGKPVQKQVDEQADIYEFLFHYVTRATASEHLRRNAG
jgi:prolyl oligopeptidase